MAPPRRHMPIGDKCLFAKRAKTLCPRALREIVYDIPKGPTGLRAETNLESFVRVPVSRDGTKTDASYGLASRRAGGWDATNPAAQPAILRGVRRARKAAVP